MRELVTMDTELLLLTGTHSCHQQLVCALHHHNLGAWSNVTPCSRLSRRPMEPHKLDLSAYCWSMVSCCHCHLAEYARGVPDGDDVASIIPVHVRSM